MARRKDPVTVEEYAALESEASFQARVIELAKLRGWLVYHPHDSRRSAEGFPDLTLARRGRAIFAELKTARGVVQPEQWEWLGELSGLCGHARLQGRWERGYGTAGVLEVAVWRPGDWAVIEEILR